MVKGKEEALSPYSVLDLDGIQSSISSKSGHIVYCYGVGPLGFVYMRYAG